MRRLFCLVLYLGMVVVGSINIAGFFIHGGGRLVILAAGCFLVAFGGYLLWSDRRWLITGTRGDAGT
jgi:hypothetical protein